MLNRRSAFTLAISLAVCVACRQESAGTGPGLLTAEMMCDDSSPVCGQTDGVIHDGTGNGSVQDAPDDPSPGAPGVFLGNLLSGWYCYADYNSFMRDEDHDWLDDECEFQLAKAFAPALAMSPNDGCAGGEPYWSAKYFPNDPAYGWGDFVRIMYMPAYYADCGQGTILGDDSHNGDSEFLMVGVEFNPATQHWQTREMIFSAHLGTPTASGDYVLRDGLEYPARYLAYPRAWVSRHKHANYHSQDGCNRNGYGIESCVDNVPLGRLRILRGRNAGSRFVDRFPQGAASANPRYQNGRVEFFYTSARFRGWQLTGNGATPYQSLLLSTYYECFDPTYTLTSACYAGAGPNAPSSTRLRGTVTGPTQVTAYQTNTWSSFFTGGTLPRRAEWWLQYASDGAPQLVQTSGAISDPFTAGSWTSNVPRCENFTLTVNVWGADGRGWSDRHNVAVTCPPPPLTAWISGPTNVTVKATYTWTVNPSGGAGQYGYQWSAYFPRSGWTLTLGGGQSQAMTVFADDGDVQMQVTVTSGTQSLTATTYVTNCITCGTGGGKKKPPLL